MKDLRLNGDVQRGDSMLRVTASTPLMREIVDLLSVLTEAVSYTHLTLPTNREV